MAKVFNVTAACIPEKHYMVKLDQRIKEIKTLVDDGKYFMINRARQFGKQQRYWHWKNIYRTIIM